MGWADRKRLVRESAHKAFAVPCWYKDATMTGAVELMARLHTRSLTGGNNGLGSGYAQVVEGVEAVIFDKDELECKGVKLRTNGRVSFPDYGSDFLLNTRDDNSGPVNEKWSLASK